MHINCTVASPDLLPTYAKPGDAGLDLRANINAPLRISGMHTERIPTGVRMAIPQGFVGLVCPRSGHALRHSVTVGNAPGIIDSGFRGEICVIAQPHDGEELVIYPGERIAQLVIVPVITASLHIVESLDETERGEGGFGSTGKN